ncbi:unnamed protein product [Caenorhabditis nigoni]
MVLDSYATSKMSEHSQGPPNMVFKNTESRNQGIWRNMLLLDGFRPLFMLGKVATLPFRINSRLRLLHAVLIEKTAIEKMTPKGSCPTISIAALFVLSRWNQGITGVLACNYQCS